MLLPFISPDQNRRLFPQSDRPKQPIRAKRGVIQANLRSLLGGTSEFDYDYQDTRTQLPCLTKGPREDAEALLTERWGSYLVELETLATTAPTEPPKPISQAGWVYYPNEGGPVAVDYPSDRVILFDTETYVQGGNHPVMAVAVGISGWYVWQSVALVSRDPSLFPEELIPLGPTKLVVAHNALFDLSKTKEQYSLSTAERHVAFCTMAVHGTLASLGGEQVKRASLAARGNRGPSAPWQQVTCSNSLKECLKLYCGVEVDKEARNAFLGPWEGIKAQGDSLLEYCAKDVANLWLLLIPMYRGYREANPSIVSLAGMFEASRMVIPLSGQYHQKIALNNMKLAQQQRELEVMLGRLAKEALDCPAPENDPWLSQLDWTPAKTGKNKGLPAWYRKTLAKPITIGGNLAPLLTKTTWAGNPLVYDSAKKWCYQTESGLERLPHPDGKGVNVGSPHSKHFAKYAEDGVLSSSLDFNVPKLISQLAYWTSYQSRFAEEYTRALEDGGLAVVPTTNLKGTLTGRQSHRLWLTMAQCKPGRLGTDLAHAIQAPVGYKIVNWDEDTEEVRIAALWADYYEGEGLGVTPMSQIAFLGVNTGDLKTATDAHSVTANLAGISRSDAKTANFRDIFGGGVKTQTDALRSQHPDWEDKKIRSLVAQIITAKRGTKQMGIYRGGTDSAFHNQANTIANTVDFRLPMTDRLIPKVINPRYDTLKQFFTSRYNFPVQGSGADILDATNALVPIVAGQAGIPESAYGLVFDRHDEFVYLVKEEYAESFAEVANTVHCWAWAMLLQGMGFDWMPTPLARLSGINIDTTYRKEVDMAVDAGYGFGFSNPQGHVIK